VILIHRICVRRCPKIYLISHHFSSNTIFITKRYKPIETKTPREFYKTVKQEKKKKSNICKNQKERSELKFLSII
ncbi:hypothetical protein ISN44_As01g002780, partial [Arabidopsis suecica]